MWYRIRHWIARRLYALGAQVDPPPRGPVVAGAGGDDPVWEALRQQRERRIMAKAHVT